MGLALLKGMPRAISSTKISRISSAINIPIMAKAFDIRQRPQVAFPVALL
jgi:hypothetical protein